MTQQVVVVPYLLIGVLLGVLSLLVTARQENRLVVEDVAISLALIPLWPPLIVLAGLAWFMENSNKTLWRKK